MPFICLVLPNLRTLCPRMGRPAWLGTRIESILPVEAGGISDPAGIVGVRRTNTLFPGPRVLTCRETPVRISMDTPYHRGEDDWANAVAPWDARRVIRMRKLSILCAALFCLSLTASAQDSTAAFDASSSASEPAAPASLIPADREPWQLGVGFQYLQFNVLGQKFHDFGYQADVTRYFNQLVWCGRHCDSWIRTLGVSPALREVAIPWRWSAHFGAQLRPL